MIPNPFRKLSVLGASVALLLLWPVAMFIGLSIAALVFRFTFTWGIDIISWMREVMNNLASIYPGTS